MCILTSSTTEFSFAPRNISVQCSTALVWVGCRALTFQQLPVTTELPITDKLSVPTSMNVNSAFSAQYGIVDGTAEKSFLQGRQVLLMPDGELRPAVADNAK